MSKRKYDWDEIQKFYNNGGTWRDIEKVFGCACQSVAKAVARGDLKLRNKIEAAVLSHKKTGPRKHTEETKRKISKIRLKYLKENPDKVPYLLNHSSKKSYPEIIFENALKSSGITGWEYNYQNGIYSYDFAWPKQKLDVEIDGGTHLTDKVKRIDNRRDKFSKSQGWTVLRFTAKEVKNDLDRCIKTVIVKIKTLTTQISNP
jgi:very-short-patch-repair endonuclease